MLSATISPDAPGDSPDRSTQLEREIKAASDALGKPSHGYYARSLSALSKKVLVFVRQSSPRQVKQNTHSTSVQLHQMDRYNVPPERIEYSLALGETGTESDERRAFEQMLVRLASGEIGVIAVARHDRLGRNGRDHARIMDIMREHSIMLMVDGHVFDPASPEDAMILGIYAAFAEYENKLRARWMRLTKLSAARRLALRMALPAPLIWASPDDPEYVRALRASGLEGWLDDLPTVPTAGRVFSLKHGRRYFPLPVPDADVMRACQLLLRFLVEEDSVADAVARTIRDPEWPANHRGEFPSVALRVYAPGQPLVRWMSCDRDIVARWACLPALQGTYSHFSRSLANDLTPAERDNVRVTATHAFRAVIPGDDARRIADVVESGIKRRRRPDSPRLHRLPHVRCGQLNEHGKPCGARFYAMHFNGRHKGYGGESCGMNGHTGTVGAYIDDLVLDTIAETLSPRVIASHIDMQRLEVSTRTSERSRLRKEYASALGMRDEAARLELEASRRGEDDDFEHYKSERQRQGAELKRIQRTLDALGADDEALRNATASEVDQIIRLATDLPKLVSRVREHPRFARRLVRECLRAVHVSTPGKYIYRVELEFPTGQRVARWLMTAPVPSTQATRVYCSLCLSENNRAEHVATEIASHVGGQFAERWSARRVRGAALMHELFETGEPRNGTHEGVTALAARIGESSRVVLGAAIRGELGPARRTATSESEQELALAPSEHELHSAFPEYARRSTASARNWPLRDTVRLADAARLSWQSSAAICERARSLGGRSGIARDLAGRSYVRFSLVRVPEISDAATATLAVRPDLASLDLDGWIPLSEATAGMPMWSQIEPHAPTLDLPTSVPHHFRRFVWVGKEVLQRAANASIREAAREAGVSECEVDELRQAERALTHFQRAFPGLTRSVWQRHLTAPSGAVRRIKALGIVGTAIRPVWYVLVPESVFCTTDVEAFNAWLIPGYRPVPERRSRTTLREKHGVPRKQSRGGHFQPPRIGKLDVADDVAQGST